jgi:hypothetical protein
MEAGTTVSLNHDFARIAITSRLTQLMCLRCLEVVGTGTSAKALLAAEKAHRCKDYDK